MTDQRGLGITLESLDALMHRAGDGDRAAAEKFYRWLLDASLIVPERHQSHPNLNLVKDAPPFLSVLGIDDGGTPTIPAFLTPELLEEWAETSLAWRSISFRDLLELLPEGWSIGINFGRNPEKEITWWEASELRGGIDALPAVLEELLPAEGPVETLGASFIPSGSYPDLERNLADAAQRDERIVRVALLKEEGVALDGSPRSKILIGVEIRTDATESKEDITALISSAASQGLIGDDPFRVFVSETGAENLVSGLFRKAPPLFERSHPPSASNILKRLASLLSPFSKGNP